MKTLTETLRDARARALFRVPYASLTMAQKVKVDELMQRACKYAKEN